MASLTNNGALKTALSTVEPDVSGGVDASPIVTLCGRDYAKVPVVALIEGVRHPSGSKYPELVLADSFGRHVDTWNGRVCVVDHPVNTDGQPILASSPDVLSTSYLGVMYDATIDDGKLKVNAYLDLSAIAETSSEPVLAMWERLLDGEVVEVSVGAIVYAEDVKGTYKGKQYRGKWSVVIPDHLAFLSSGTVGACSVADGCGTFRVQSVGSIQLNEGIRMAVRNGSTGARALSKKTTAPAASGDGMGGVLKTVRPLSEASDGGCGCGGGNPATAVGTPAEQPEQAEGMSEQINSESEATEHGHVTLAGMSTAVSRMLFGADTFDGDRRSIIGSALVAYLGRGTYPYVVAYNENTVVWAQYVSANDTYKLFSMGYTSNANDAVTLSGTPVEVETRQKFVPVNKSGNTGTSGATSLNAATETKETTMSDKTYGSMDELLTALGSSSVGNEVRAAMETANAAKTEKIVAIKKLNGGDKLCDKKLAALSFDMLSTVHEALVTAGTAAGTAAGSDASARAASSKKQISEMSDPAELQEHVDDVTTRTLNYAGRAGAGGDGGAGARAASTPPKAPRVFGGTA